MTRPRVVVLGGGLSGMAAACALAETGALDVTLLESRRELGGLAGSFKNEHGVFPLGYHHVLERDRTLRFILGELGLESRVRWRRVPLLFQLDGALYDLARPDDFLRFPIGVADKIAFVRLMLRCFRKADWSDWTGRSAAELVDAWGSRSLRIRMFDPLTRVKFERSTEDVSAAWLGARLHFREGASALGYMPGTNWTLELCDSLERRALALGVAVRRGARVVALERSTATTTTVKTADGASLVADWVVSSLPTVHYAALAPDDATPHLRDIRYSALTSAIFAVRARLPREFYWMTVLDRGYSASGVFVLDALNPTLGLSGFRYVNLVTHSHSHTAPFFQESESTVESLYDDDLRRLLGVPLEVAWRVVHRVKMYSPILGVGYVNVGVRSTSHDRVFFAGNYRTFPSIVSTGTAMASGFEAARALLDAAGLGKGALLRGFEATT